MNERKKKGLTFGGFLKGCAASIVISFLLVSCVTTRNIRYESIAREQKPENFTMDIYESSNLKREFKVIGLVMAKAGKLHSTADTIEYLKMEARNMGGDALMDLGLATSDGRIIRKTTFDYASYSTKRKLGGESNRLGR